MANATKRAVEVVMNGKLSSGYRGMLQKAEAGLRKHRMTLEGIEGQTKRMRSGGGLFGGKMLVGLGAAAAGAYGAFRMLQPAFDKAMGMEDAETSFGVMLKSGARARSLLKELQSFGDSTPFEFPEIQSSARSLVAFGVQQGDVIKKLRMLGDISSGVGQPMGELAEIYGKIKVQGRVFAEDINQLQGRGIPVVQALAKQFGVNESAIRGMVQKGKIGFEEIDGALQSMTARGGIFFGMTEKQSKNVSGLLSTLRDKFNGALAEAVRKYFPQIKAGLEMLIDRFPEILASVSSFGRTAGTVLRPMGQMLLWIGKNLSWLGPLILGALAAYKAYGAYLVVLRTYELALAAARLGTPWGLVAAAIGLVIAAVCLLIKNWDKVKAAVVGAFSAAWSWLVKYVPQLRLIPAAVRLVGQVWASVWNGVTSGAKTVWSWLTRLWGLLLKIWQKTPAGMIARAVGSKIAKHAAGGIVSRPTVSWVGERGPEAIIPLRGNRPRALSLLATAGAAIGATGAPGVYVGTYAPVIHLPAGATAADLRGVLQEDKRALVQYLETLEHDRQRRSF